jgi:hypothetical protein
MGEQTGSTEIGVLLEGEVNLWLELGEGGGVASELLNPAFLLFRQRCLDVLKRLLQRGNLRTGFATEAKLHGRLLTTSRLLDALAILPAKAFLGRTFRDCTRWEGVT